MSTRDDADGAAMGFRSSEELAAWQRSATTPTPEPAAAEAPAVEVLREALKTIASLPSGNAAQDRRVMRQIAHAALAAQPKADSTEPKRCPYCDDTGDVHGFDGEWRGRCACPVGKADTAAAAEGVKIPTNEDEAALMALLGMNWLKEHAPHRLRSASGDAKGVDVYEALRGVHLELKKALLGDNALEEQRERRAKVDRIALSELRRVMRGWHEQAVDLGFDGVADALAVVATLSPLERMQRIDEQQGEKP